VGCVADRVLAPDAHENLADADARGEAHGLAEGAAHARLEAIGPSAREHLVEAEDVVGVDANAHVERVLSIALAEELVAGDTSRLE